MILLDTNVVSELARGVAPRDVATWLDRRFPECAIASITIFELGAGLALLPAGQRRNKLSEAIGRVIRRFGPRVYAFDAQAAQASVKLLEHARAHGLGIHQIPHKLADLQRAGIALAYGMQFATRNTSDFQGTGLVLINPWEPTS